MIAASKLDFAARMNNPFRFVCFVRVFMALKVLVRLGGSNDNYHHISANVIAIDLFTAIALPDRRHEILLLRNV